MFNYLYPYGIYLSNLSQIMNDMQLKLYMNKRNYQSLRSKEI